jgi:hypothetical protein
MSWPLDRRKPSPRATVTPDGTRLIGDVTNITEP